MRDPHTPGRILQLHPKVREEVAALINQVEEGLPQHLAIRVVEHFRSIDYQNQLYAQGRTKPGKIVTNAKGGTSYHNYGLAIDFAVLVDTNRDGKYDQLHWDTARDMDGDGKPEWKEMVNVFVAHGWEWGGNWTSIKDYPHLQKTFGYSVKKLLEKYKNGEFIPGTPYLKL